MFRYLRLYSHFVRFSLSKSMEFRIDFFFRIVMDCVYYAVNLAFFKVLYLHTNSLGGWKETDTMVFVGTYLFVDAAGLHQPRRPRLLLSAASVVSFYIVVSRVLF